MGNNPQLFFLNASRSFGEHVAHRLALAAGAHEEREFEYGEHKTRPLVEVRDRDVYVIQSLHGDAAQSVNDKLCRLLFFVGALKDAAAARVTAVVPFLAYARKDSRTNPRDPVTLRYLAAMFEAVGTDALVTLDVHNLAAYQNAFRCTAEHLDACHLFAEHFLPLVQGSETVVVSPDSGGVKRADRFRHCLSKVLGAPVQTAYCEKYRKADQLSGDLLVGDVAGKAVIVYDDMIVSGQTMARAAEVCRKQGATRLFGAATHGLFSAGAAEALDACALEAVLVTDSVAQFRSEQSVPAQLTVLGCGALFAEAIRRMYEGGALSDLAAW
jgi:ribose-phosphate pyrophosphokinase